MAFLVSKNRAFNLSSTLVKLLESLNRSNRYVGVKIIISFQRKKQS